MRNNRLSLGALISFLIVGGLIVSACGPQISSTYQLDNLELVQAIPLWEQVNPGGFGGTQAPEVTALESFNGYLYAGNQNPVDPAILIDGAQIFRSANGADWLPVTQPGFGISHDIAPAAILDFVVFNNQLYAGTGQRNASQIWRSSNGTTWAPMDVTGFSDPDNVDVSALAVYAGKIYAAVMNRVTGAQVWSSFTGDNNSWTQVAPTTPGTAPSRITGFAEFSFDGGLYAAVESESPAQVWRSYGADWEVIVNDGFGDANTSLTGGLIEFGGFLYVGAGNTATGAQLWRTSDGVAWELVSGPGLGDQNNREVEAVFVFQNQLHVALSNPVTGIEIWRWSDSVLWEQLNLDGFGDGNNTLTNGSNAAASFGNQLYVGSMNSVDGGELWRSIPQIVDTPTFTPTDTATNTATNTATFTATNTSTDTPTSTATFTPTDTVTFTPTDTATNTSTNTATFTPTETSTFTPTYTNTPTETSVITPTYTATFTPTNTASLTPTYTATDTLPATPVDTATFTPTNTATLTPTFTPTYTLTPTSPVCLKGKVTGGGVIGTNKNNLKLTFGFTVQCEAGDAEPKGNLTFQDHTSELRLKAQEFEQLLIDDNHVTFTGVGVLDNGQEVTFTVDIEVLQAPDKPDMFHINIPALNYEAGGALHGGNITIHN